jgi:hypothetical protein
MGMNFAFNLLGRIRNTRLPASHCLKPLYEAVSNSIQAIEDAEEKKGCIEVKIERTTTSQGVFVQADNTKVVEHVRSFAVTDNGIGFTPVHFKSFLTSDSQLKAERGCKGVGRFIWLKAFRHVEVDSVFEEDNQFHRRTFRFAPTEEGVDDEKLEASGARQRRTTVRLVDMAPAYRDECPKQADTIAHRIVEYCLPHFVHQKAPKIVVIDSDGARLDLDDIFKEMRLYEKTITFKVKTQSFQITHLLVPGSHEPSHRLHSCANGWSVEAQPLAEKMPELRSQSSPIRDQETGRQLFYAGYLSGGLLDERVSSERIDFAIAEEPGMFEDFSMTVLMEEALEKVNAYLTPHLRDVRQQRDDQIRDYVANHAPQYKPLLKHRPQLLADIPPNMPPEKLELKLYEANQKYNVELNEQRHRLLCEQDDSAVDIEQHQERVAAFMEEWNEEGMAKLAWHVGHRQATLSFLDQELARDKDGKYRLEHAIHRVIFPLKSTSDDVPREQQNLWILDEKLAYHFYLASDVPFSRIKPVKVKSKDRPDIIVFNNPPSFGRPIAIVDSEAPFGDVVIFEFKRPMRDDYSPDENPLDQVYRYTRRLRSNEAVDRRGRPITLRADTPIAAHIVCDITPTLREMADNDHLRPTPDGEGFFGYHEKLGIYIEIVSFTKLLSDARKRNAILFELLGFRQPNTARPSPSGGCPELAETAG